MKTLLKLNIFISFCLGEILMFIMNTLCALLKLNIFISFYLGIILMFIPITIVCWISNIIFFVFSIDPKLLCDPTLKEVSCYEPLTVKYELSKGKKLFPAMWYVISNLEWWPIGRTGLF